MTTTYGDFLRSRYQEINIPIGVQTCLLDFPEWLNWVVVVEEDAPDSLVILPILQRLAEFAPRSSIYILSAEDDLALVDSALDESDLSEENLLEADLPMVLFCSEEWQLLSQWGPRPQAVEPFLDQWLENNPEFATLAESEDEAEQQAHAQLLDGLTYEMRVWFISELDHACGEEIKAVIESIATELDNAELDDDSEEIEDTELGDSFRPMVGFEQDESSSAGLSAAEDSLPAAEDGGRSKSDDTGSDDTGADDTGADDTGANGTGADDTGTDDAADVTAQEKDASDAPQRDNAARESRAKDSRSKDSRKDSRPKRHDRRSRNRSRNQSNDRRSNRSNS